MKSRAKESIRGILVGFFLMIGAFPLLFWNEGRAVQKARVLEDGRGSVVSLEEPSVDPANQGRVVHIVGELTSRDRVRDPQFSLEIEGVRLTRRVEVYQWQEQSRRRSEKSQSGSERTVTERSYERLWSDEPIDSSAFHEAGHDNPPASIANATFDAVNVTVGAFRLSPALIAQVDEFQDLPALPEVASRASLGRPVHVAGTAYYVGENPNAPEIGDLRVTFRLAPAGSMVSVIGRQVGETFGTWRVEERTHTPQLRMGEHSVDAMFGTLETDSDALIWALRILGLLLLLGGLILMLRPLTEVAKEVTILGPILKGQAVIASSVLAVGFWLSTIGAAWIAYRPVVGFPIAFVAFVVTAGGLVLKHRRDKPRSSVGDALPDDPSGVDSKSS